MNPEIVQLAAEHGTRSASLFWGWEVALEMFLGGTAGALMFFRGLKRFAPEMDRILHRVVLGCLLLAGALLFLDLGAKQHVYRLLISWRPESVIFWGTWVFVLSLIANVLRLRLPGVVLGAGLMLYPGLLLASMAARPIWRGPSVPLEFLLLSLGSGVAVLMLVDPAIRNRSVWVRPTAFGLLAGVFAARVIVLFAGQG
jgi:formate-dependent nitrite reductase membrane component NrfD